MKDGKSEAPRHQGGAYGARSGHRARADTKLNRKDSNKKTRTVSESYSF